MPTASLQILDLLKLLLVQRQFFEIRKTAIVVLRTLPDEFLCEAWHSVLCGRA